MIQSAIEERWNWLTHSFGFVLFFIGQFVLLAYNNHLTNYSTFAIVVYNLSLLLLYFASALYHYVSGEELKKKLRVLDHISIYVLIAGTYTPVTLITLLGSKGWLLFAIVWCIALLGTMLKLFFTGRFEVFSLVLYLVMGWLIIIDIDYLSNIVGGKGMNLLMTGGAAYTLGVIFYVMKRVRFHHVIWHFFVLTGSILNYLFILYYIV